MIKKDIKNNGEAYLIVGDRLYKFASEHYRTTDNGRQGVRYHNIK